MYEKTMEITYAIFRKFSDRNVVSTTKKTPMTQGFFFGIVEAEARASRNEVK